MLLMIGPPRSGKSTIGRILTGLIGKDSVAGLQLSHLASSFGLEGLLGKPLAIIPYARFDAQKGPTVAERLLSISGEDTIAIDRKNKPSVATRLPTLLMMLTNDPPKITDVSGALANRFIVLKMTESFLGKEKVGLEAELMEELPSILQWALNGWKRGHERGSLIQPRSAQGAFEDLLDGTSLIHAFIRECCVVDPDAKVAKQSLFDAWSRWCSDGGVSKYVGHPFSFGRLLTTQ
jgi:putative DNA primase/helicase